MFQNGFTKAITEAEISMYVDNHQIFSSDHLTGSVEEELSQDGNDMTKWYRENILQVNIKKYQSMVLGKRKGTEGMNMFIGGVEIEQSQNIKLLGIDRQ